MLSRRLARLGYLLDAVLDQRLAMLAVEAGPPKASTQLSARRAPPIRQRAIDCQIVSTDHGAASPPRRTDLCGDRMVPPIGESRFPGMGTGLYSRSGTPRERQVFALQDGM